MNRLDASALNAACEAEALPWRVQVVDEIGSTSDSVREAALAGESTGLVLFAESQTAGRGRRDNRWITPGGKDLMFSMLLRPTCSGAFVRRRAGSRSDIDRARGWSVGRLTARPS